MVFKRKNIAGNRYGKLVAIRYVGKNKHRKSIWLCKCDCGTEKEICLNQLSSGDTKSCGCLNKEVRRQSFVDFTGKRFGKLYVKKFVGFKKHTQTSKGRNRAFFLCECDCSKTTEVCGHNLQTGNTRSCGKCNIFISYGEKTVKKILDELKIKYKQQKTFPQCKNKNRLRFDFYLPDYNICIEYQGRQHYACIGKTEESRIAYKNIVLCDSIKRKFCETNNIRLLEIKHTCKDIEKEVLSILTKSFCKS